MDRLGIGICGKAKSGKNTVAEMLEHSWGDLTNRYSHYPATIALADPIKKMAQIMFPWADRNGWWGSSSLRDNPIDSTSDLTFRQVLIDLGTKGRAYDPNHWVKVFDDTINSPLYETADIIASDIRFKNEWEYLRSKHFFLIKLLRNEQTASKFIQEHPTETNQNQIPLEDFDAIIENNGTLNDLQLKVQALKDQLIAHQK